jgi:hypothetical protein
LGTAVSLVPFPINGKDPEVWDKQGAHTTVTMPDAYRSNRMAHVADGVLMSAMRSSRPVPEGPDNEEEVTANGSFFWPA